MIVRQPVVVVLPAVLFVGLVTSWSSNWINIADAFTFQPAPHRLCSNSKGSTSTPLSSPWNAGQKGRSLSRPLRVSSSAVDDSASVSTNDDDDDDDDGLNLTPELARMTKAFAMLPDEKTRYKQLLFLAQKLPPVDDNVRIPSNKVPGCLSTVYVDCTTSIRDSDGETIVNYTGDSDGLLTKGLVALLVRGLSGNTPQEIQGVNPEFINVAKISQSLTPGRNNGFLNMVAVMKRKAMDAVASTEDREVNSAEKEEEGEEGVINGDDIITTFETIDGKPMYNAMMTKIITFLKPTVVTLVDNSDQHAGHAGSKGFDGESHFELTVVTEAFDGLALVKRHQLIYMILGDIMEQIHALQITAKSPAEWEAR